MGGWLNKHENITNLASNSLEVGAGAELSKIKVISLYKQTLEIFSDLTTTPKFPTRVQKGQNDPQSTINKTKKSQKRKSLLYE